jgi:hypothetical protein
VITVSEREKMGKKQPGVVVHTSNPSFSGGRDRRIMSLKSAWANLGRPYLRNKIKTKGLGCDSSDRELAKALDTILSAAGKREKKGREGRRERKENSKKKEK